MTASRQVKSKWLSLAIGVLFSGIGLVGIITSLTQYDRFTVRQWSEDRPYGSSPVIFQGFDPGGTALLCMLSFAVGVAVAAGPFLGVTGRQNLALLVAVAWHGLGIGTGVCYATVAPRPYGMMPFLVIVVYEWAGLIPLALGIRKSRTALHESVWNLWGGIVPGAVVGGIAGSVIDFANSYANSRSGAEPVAGGNWLTGILIGGAATGLVALGLTLRRRLGIANPAAPDAAADGGV